MSQRDVSCFLIEHFSEKSESCYLEVGLYPSITDVFHSMNSLIQERYDDSESCITVKMSQRTQEVEIYLANEGFGFAFLSRTYDTFSVELLVMNLEEC